MAGLGPSSPVTTLVMDPERCGVEFGERDGRTGQPAREVDVYVQHDSFVQQVIDEQFLVQCAPGEADGKVSYLNKVSKGGPGVVRDVTVTSKFAGKKKRKRKKKTEEDPDRVFLRPGTVESVQQHEEKFVSNLVDSNMEVVAESPKWVDKSNMMSGSDKEEDMYEAGYEDGEEDEGRAGNYDSDWSPHTGWMELEGVEEDDLMIGDNVTLVVRLRQGGGGSSAGDAMVGSCKARGAGRPGSAPKGALPPKQELTDYRGCSVDEDVFGSFAAKSNARTGVKVLRSSFGMFKFSGFPELILECAVLVCRRSCPQSRDVIQ